MNATSLSILADWEKRLVLLVHGAQLQLLGELDISDDERKLLGQSIGEYYRVAGNQRALEFFRRETPCTFAVFLVAQGVFGYQEGDYWHDVRQTIGVGLDANQQGDWGRTFESILQELDKPLFEEIKGHRYLKMILAHGGIPNYCLPDFFKHLLQPAVTRPRYADLDAPDLIDELLQRSAIIFADIPVRRFLQYGGKMAEDFFERCCTLAREFLETRLMPDATEVGLPPRIVEAYQQWIQSQSKLASPIERDDELRLRKPSFVFDPWGGFAIKLPPQPVPKVLSQSTFAWRICIGEKELSLIPLRVRRGFDQRTIERDFPLQHPAERYATSFMIDGQERRVWRFEGISQDKPILLFNPSDGALVRWFNAVPAQLLWVVLPNDSELSWEGTAQAVNLPDCFGGWADYRALEIDASEATRLNFQFRGQPLSWSVRPDNTQLRPYFVGGNLFPITQPSRRAPLYVGEPPIIRIPLTDKHKSEIELASWSMTIRTRETSSPALHETLRLAELKPQLSETDDYADVRLNSAALLGNTPYGSYDIRLRGPLGRDIDLSLRIWQYVNVEPLPVMCWPDPKEGPPKVAVKIETSQVDSLTCPQDEGRLENAPNGSEQNKRRFTIWAHSDTTLLRLTISLPMPSGGTVSVPLEIPIPRPRWLLLDESSPTALPEWSNKLLHESLNALTQMTAPALWASLPLSQDLPIQLQLRLCSSDTELRQVSQWNKRQSEQRQWRFSLLQFRDELRASHEPVLRFELACSGLPENDSEVVIPLLSITQALHTEDIHLQLGKKKDGQIALRLSWHEPKQRLRYRHIRLWPVWEPWKSPIESAIPDNVTDTFDIPVSAAQLSGRFRVQFTIEDPWISQTATRQMPLKQEQADLDLKDPQDRLDELELKVQQDLSNKFDFLLERAHICETLGDMPQALRLAHWCGLNSTHGSLSQVLALHDLLKRLNDHPALQSLEEAIFAPEKIDWWWKAHNRHEKVSDRFEEYLSRIPPIRFEILPASLCQWMLDIETVQQAALERLMRLRNSVAVVKTVELFKTGRLADADALEFLTMAGEFAVTQLEQRADDEYSIRLLLGLAPRLGAQAIVVTAGMWIRTEAGWGRIEAIYDPATKQKVSRFLRHERRYMLSVNLRPAHDNEPIEVDFPNEEIRFIRSSVLYYCVACQQFIASNPSTVDAHFQVALAHNRHLIKRTGQLPDNAPFLSEKNINFFHSPPEDELK